MGSGLEKQWPREAAGPAFVPGLRVEMLLLVAACTLVVSAVIRSPRYQRRETC